MNRTATVTETDPLILVINNDVPSAKAATSRRFWGVRERAYRVANPSGLSLTAGDTVEIHLPPGRTVAASALMFLLPLALFPAGFMTAKALVPGLGDGPAFLAGFGALLAGLPLGALLRMVIGRLRHDGFSAIPEVIRVLTPAEVLSCRLNKDGCGNCSACG